MSEYAMYRQWNPVRIVGGPVSMHTHKVGGDSVKLARVRAFWCIQVEYAHFACIGAVPIITNSTVSHLLYRAPLVPTPQNTMSYYTTGSNVRVLCCIILLDTKIKFWREHMPPTTTPPATYSCTCICTNKARY